MTRPKRNEYLLLDGTVGWSIAAGSVDGLVAVPPDQDLRLSPLPGQAALLGWPQQAVETPVAMAVDRGGRLLVAGGDRLFLLSPEGGMPLRGVGGRGRAMRRFRTPRGLAVTAAGAILVADTGNDRVQMFSPAPYALLQVWDEGLKQPWGTAVDAGGTIHVVDRGNRRVVRLATDGRTLGDYGGAVLTDPTQIACGPGGVTAVVDDAAIVAFPSGRKIESVAAPQALAFDADGILYVGDAQGILYKFAPDANVYGRYNLIWYGAAGLENEASIVNLLWDRKLGLVLIFHEPGDPPRQRIWTIDPAGANGVKGTLVTAALDSGIEKCTWHRIQLAASVPQGTSLQVDTFTSEPGPVDLTTAAFTPCLIAGFDNPDGLVQSPPGRKLWLRLTLRSDGRQTPEIRSIKAYFPRASYLRYLPAVYQEDPESRLFLERFLSIFQTSNDDWDRRIDDIWQLFDPFSTPAGFFPVLASWVALEVEPSWSDAERRRMLKQAVERYARRGTIAGLVQAIADYAGVRNASIVEDFKLRRWAALPATEPLDGGVRLWSRDVYGKLQADVYSRIGSFRLGSDPEPALEPLAWGAHRFRVFFPAGPYDAAAVTQRVREVVEREKPAYTQAAYCAVLPRMRVGVQARLGVDAVVGDISYAVLGSAATLNYDSILSCSRAERELRALSQAPYPRVGSTAAIL